MQRRWMSILWPSFLTAAAAEVLFFAFIDPEDLAFLGEPLGLARMTVYSIGFFLFWALAAASSTLTCYLERPGDEVNRCPLPPPGRPYGCPKREDTEAGPLS